MPFSLLYIQVISSQKNYNVPLSYYLPKDILILITIHYNRL